MFTCKEHLEISEWRLYRCGTVVSIKYSRVCMFNPTKVIHTAIIAACGTVTISGALDLGILHLRQGEKKMIPV